MGGVPKKRHTKGSRNQRRMHIFLKKPALKPCEKCGVLIKLHTVCPSCGFYKGREVVNVLARLDRKERKTKERQIKENEQKTTQSAAVKENPES